MKKIGLSLLIICILSPNPVYSLNTCSSFFGADPHLYMPSAKGSGTDIYFKERVGKVEEHTIRKGQTAAHIYMDATQDPYMFFAFPAGNSGVAVWFKSNSKANFSAISEPTAVSRENDLNGAEFGMKTDVKNLKIDDSVLGSMRFIRDRELNIKAPKEVQTGKGVLMGNRLVYYRKSLNGLFAYRLEIEPIGDTKIVRTASGFELKSDTEVKIKLSGFTSETPLTPMRPEDIFTAKALATMDAKKLQAFMFLFTKEKLMAGSPRYFSVFGRDSIYTLNELIPHLKPEAIETVLNIVMSGMDPQGIISHEKHEGDFASYERMKHGQKYIGVNDTIEDRKMVDDDFAFAIVMSKYLKRFPKRAKSFLEGHDQRGLSRRTLVKNNFEFVMKKALPFAENPIYSNLIGLHNGEKTGQWRDSENGLGGGKYPFDVNAALVPGAIKALADLHSSSFSEFYNPQKASELSSIFNIWNTKVVQLFEVRIPQKDLSAFGESYLKDLGINSRKLPPLNEDLIFPAISLDANGRPIPIMHSDDSMMMTFGHPSQNYLKNVSQRILIQFPYGLFTPVGILVANPIFASKEIQSQFGETKYHGQVSWTMQEDLLISGIDRQLTRQDLNENLRAELIASKEAIEKVIHSKAAMGGTEVFAISYQNGAFKAVPFAGDAKSNSNQLWSHLRIAQPKH